MMNQEFEVREKMEGLVNWKDLQVLKGKLRYLTLQWIKEGFDRDDISDYLLDESYVIQQEIVTERLEKQRLEAQKTMYEKWQEGKLPSMGTFVLNLFHTYQSASGNNQETLARCFPIYFIEKIKE